jgi:hypothetical protein
MEEIISAIPADSLSDTERASLLFMIEEEKVARDSYVLFSSKFGGNVFANIQKSEQSHIDAVAYLLNRYDMSLPQTLSTFGTFENPDLQALYDALTEKGSTSWVEALKVGAAIEEVDIMDLKRIVAEDIDNADLVAVFANLIKGSENHLRAFVKNLSKQGVSYTPQYLSEADYRAIING